jgi:hypothetical protein
MNNPHKKYLGQYLDVLHLNTKEPIGYLAELSDNNLLFISEHEYAIGDVIDIVIENEIDDEPYLFISTQIQVKWHKHNINPRQYCMGCQILNISATDYAKLVELVESFSFDDREVELNHCQNE